MSTTELVLNAVLVGLAVRHVLVLGAALRAHRFLKRGFAEHSAQDSPNAARPHFHIVLPVLREAGVIGEAVAHFQAVADGHAAQIVVVTTAREQAESARHTGVSNTVVAVEELARAGRCVHLHYPDAEGVKADQLNFAVDYLASSMRGDASASTSFLICYDADSRPPLDSLAWFETAIARNPHVDVFHQSSRFEVRDAEAQPRKGLGCWLRGVIADAGALRANRFVLAYEIPRLLNRSAQACALKRKACSYVYAHVTGHGLCVRLPLLQILPFPQRSPLEDMHYSFILGSRNQPMLPIPGLDSAEVPGSLRVQLEQAARWFFGPGRFFHYLKDPATEQGLRARLMAFSASAICVEWLSCAIMPVLLVSSLRAVNSLTRATTVAFTIVYALQLLVAEASIGSAGRLRDRIGRVLAYPVSCTLFGFGGMLGAARLLRGVSSTGKTERASA